MPFLKRRKTETGLKITEIEELGYRDRYDVPILIAEDSVLLNKLIVESLRQAGYENLIHTENGQEAYDVICQCKAEGTLKQKVQCIITDIEMPLMDGHRLTKLVKEDEFCKALGVERDKFDELYEDFGDQLNINKK